MNELMNVFPGSPLAQTKSLGTRPESAYSLLFWPHSQAFSSGRGESLGTHSVIYSLIIWSFYLESLSVTYCDECGSGCYKPFPMR